MAYIRFDGEDVIEGNIVRGVTSTAFSNNTSSISAFFTSSTATSSDAGKYMIDLYNLNPLFDHFSPLFHLIYLN